jgi:hypothetical protein
MVVSASFQHTTIRPTETPRHSSAAITPQFLNWVSMHVGDATGKQPVSGDRSSIGHWGTMPDIGVINLFWGGRTGPKMSA